VLLFLRQHSEEAGRLQAGTVPFKGDTGVPKCESRRGSGVGRHDRRAKSPPAPRGLVGAGRRSSWGIFSFVRQGECRLADYRIWP
jgi:hypothetical protein